MNRILVAAALLVGTSVPALAWECPERNTVYESSEAGNLETVRFQGPNLVLSTDGQEQVYQTAGDSNVKVARLASETDAPRISFFTIDLSRIADDDEPDQLLVFDNRVYWPTCQQ